MRRLLLVLDMDLLAVDEQLGLEPIPGLLARRLSGPALLAGLLGGLAMIAVMILVMGAAGMGYATPLNLGMAAFVFTITPPMPMLPRGLVAWQ